MATPISISHHENLETFTLIWLDSSVNTSQDNIDTKLLLRKAIHRVKTFEDSDACIEYIRSLSRERVVLIVSGRLGQEVVPLIHQFSQLIAIYVYCSNKKRNEEWAKHFMKIKGVVVDLNELITKIQTDQTKRNEYKIDEPLPISVLHINSQEQHSSTINNENFISFHLLIDCLRRMKSNLNDKQQLILLCQKEYQGNENELNIVQEFETNYSPDRAIWWFTRDSFVCRMLNKAFQVINIDLLYYFHFIIRDIRLQLKDNKGLYPIHTYRAQLMSNQELQLLKDSIGEFISINTFLSTIPNYERALEILNKSDASNDLNRVLFEIYADPRLDDIQPFSDITSLNYFTGVEMVLFMAGMIFHLIDISEENNIVVIRMEACSDSDKRIKNILENIKAECYQDEANLLSLGFIFAKMKKFDEAEKYYHRVLDEMPNDHHSIARCYQELASIAVEKQDYDLSLELYQKALHINRSILRSEDPEIASEYNTIANVYVTKGDFIEACNSYNEALKIWIQALGKDHPKVATCYTNMAYAFEMNGKYLEAIDYYQKALVIRQRTLPDNHPDLANLHNHIADIDKSNGEMEQALKHYDFALKILTKSNSTTHPDVLMTMKNIGLTYEAAGNFKQALVQFEKLASLYRQLSPPNHSEITEITKDIQRVFSQLNKKTLKFPVEFF